MVMRERVGVLKRQAREARMEAIERFETKVKEMLGVVSVQTKTRATPERLIALVAEYFGIPVEEFTVNRGKMFLGRVRRGTLAYDVSYIQARAVAYYLLYHYTDLSYKDIGRLFTINGEPVKPSGVTIALHKIMSWIEFGDKLYGRAALTLHRYASIFYLSDPDKRLRLRLRHELHINHYYEE